MKKLAILGALVIGLGTVGSTFAGVTVTTSLSGPATVLVGEEAAWDITITASSDQDVTGVVIRDGMGADLDEIVVNVPTQGTADAAKKGKGKMGATMVAWNVGDIAAGGTATLVVTVTTGFNPTGKHEFTEAELMHELDGGASATYFFEGIEYESPETMPLTVDVIEPTE
jgi:hypothetical protein